MIVVGLTGGIGSGKSTVAKAVAARLGLAYLDTGAMYRAVAFAALSGGLNLADTDAVLAVAQTLDLQLDQSSCVVNGVDATEAIRGTEVTQAVSVVAALPAVRAEMVQRQRQWAQDRDGGVMEGRDIGSVVFPDAALKIYLTASEEVRAQRRAAEAGGEDVVAVAADLGRRDEVDSQRKASPLVEAEGSVVVDTSTMTIDQVVDHVVGLLK